jgi:DNA-binding transcriptional regulator LsrR (DeoR family)
MGALKDTAFDVINMYHEEGMKETEIAKSLGITLTLVYEILAAHENGEFEVTTDDGQPTEYEEWQDYMGGDDWDQGQYDE